MQSESNFSIMTDEDFAEMEEIPGVKEGRKMRLTAREEMNRVYAANLAAIRTAGELTQVELAKRLGIGQGSVSNIEGRRDMLLSTLLNYLEATGAEDASVSVTVNGQRIELDLTTLRGVKV